MLKSRVLRNDLTLCLNVSKEGAFFTLFGSLFHTIIDLLIRLLGGSLVLKMSLFEHDLKR